MVWGFWKDFPWTEALPFSLFFVGLLVHGIYSSLQPLCVREDGMTVLTRFLWRLSPQFLSWSAIQHYEWADETTLIVNPGKQQSTCLIPEEHVAQVKAILQERVVTSDQGG